MTLFEIGGYGSWTKEMLKITDVGNTILEIRCSVGEKSVALAKNGHRVTTIDYSQVSISLVG